MAEWNVFHLQPMPFIPGQGSTCQGEQKVKHWGTDTEGEETDTEGGQTDTEAGANTEVRQGPPGARAMLF